MSKLFFIFLSILFFLNTTTVYANSKKFDFGMNFSTALYSAVFSAGKFYDNSGISTELGVMKKKIRFFAIIEMSQFLNSYVKGGHKDTILNIGAGLSKLYIQNHIIFKMSLGPAILLNKNLKHSVGDLGVYCEISPLGFVIPLLNSQLTIFPISFLWEMPATTAIPILYIRFRFAAGLGFKF